MRSTYKQFYYINRGRVKADGTTSIFCRITMGYWMSRSSVVWGPFSIVWGLAMVVATSLLYNYRNRSS